MNLIQKLIKLLAKEQEKFGDKLNWRKFFKKFVNMYGGISRKMIQQIMKGDNIPPELLSQITALEQYILSIDADGVNTDESNSDNTDDTSVLDTVSKVGKKVWDVFDPVVDSAIDIGKAVAIPALVGAAVVGGGAVKKFAGTTKSYFTPYDGNSQEVKDVITQMLLEEGVNVSEFTGDPDSVEVPWFQDTIKPDERRKVTHPTLDDVNIPDTRRKIPSRHREAEADAINLKGGSNNGKTKKEFAQ